MKLKIVINYPPNIQAIRLAFGAAAIKHAVYTYGPTIFVPNGRAPEPHLIAHEEVHVLQQGADPAAWWQRYLIDPDFRREQELEAYQAQYAFIAETCDRKTRRFALRHLCKDFASAMYGCVVTPKEAEAMITQKLGA